VKKAVAATKGAVALVEVNVDDAGKLADKEGIELVPTLRLYRKGCPISELEGAPAPRELGRWIAEYLALKPARRTK